MVRDPDPGLGDRPGAARSRSPFNPKTWRSPLRGPWLTTVFSVVLLVGMPVLLVTGLLSYAAYDPILGRLNDMTPQKGILGFYLFQWPTRPVWLYQFNQGVHVVLGITLLPFLLAKLWSVLPKLFERPPVRSVAHALERFTLLLLVGGALFETVTGIFNVQYWYVFGFSFYQAHLFGAWVFTGALIGHIVLRIPDMVRGLRSRSLRRELSHPTTDVEVEEGTESKLVAEAPDPATISRRALLGLVGAGSGALAMMTVGQTFGPLRALSVLSPRTQSLGSGPNDFQINKTASYRGITPAMTGDKWRLSLVAGSHTVAMLTRADLLAMPQHTYELPIACVEGWSTVQTWTGVRLRDLARRAGVERPSKILVESLQKGGLFASALLASNQIQDERTLLALKVNGADLSMDHGFPARMIVPAAPGVHNTKWVARLGFSSDSV